MVDLSADFIANDDKWTGERVAADWPAFGRETIALFDILAARVEREERELYLPAETLYASGAGIGVPVRDASTLSSCARRASPDHLPPPAGPTPRRFRCRCWHCRRRTGAPRRPHCQPRTPCTKTPPLRRARQSGA